MPKKERFYTTLPLHRFHSFYEEQGEREKREREREKERGERGTKKRKSHDQAALKGHHAPPVPQQAPITFLCTYMYYL